MHMTDEEITRFIETEVDKYVVALEKEQNKLAIQQMFEETARKNKLKEMENHVKDVLKNYKVIKGKRDYLMEHLGNITINKSSPIARLKIEKTSKTNKPYKSEFDLILDKEDMIKEKIEEYNTFLNAMDSILKMVDNKEMLLDRYTNKMTIENLAIKYNLEDREVKRLLSLAFEDLLFFLFPDDIIEMI